MRTLKSPDAIGAIGLSIALVEQFFISGSPASVCNNPGRLPAVAGRKNHPEHGIAVFPSEAAGFRALYELIETQGNAGLTIQEFFAGKKGAYPGYCPRPQNKNPDGYARLTARHMRLWLNRGDINPQSPVGIAA